MLSSFLGRLGLQEWAGRAGRILLRVFGRGVKSGEEGEKCVPVGGRLNEALVFDDGCRGACGVSSLVLVLLIVGDCLAGCSFLFLSALWVDALQFPGSLGASGMGRQGRPDFVEGVWERGEVWGRGGEVCSGWRSAE